MNYTSVCTMKIDIPVNGDTIREANARAELAVQEIRKMLERIGVEGTTISKIATVENKED